MGRRYEYGITRGFRLGPEMNETLERMAEAKRLNPSDIIRDALAAYIAEWIRAGEPGAGNGRGGGPSRAQVEKWRAEAEEVVWQEFEPTLEEGSHDV